MRTRRKLMLFCSPAFFGIVSFGWTKDILESPHSAVELLRKNVAYDPLKRMALRPSENARSVSKHECLECHAEVDAYDTSLHHLMKRVPTEQSVVCKFDRVPVSYGVPTPDGKDTATFTVIPYKENDSYFFTVVDGNDPARNKTFKIAYVTGGAVNDQAYEAEIVDPAITRNGQYITTFPAPLRCEKQTGDWTKAGQTPHLWVEWINNQLVPRSENALDKNEFAQGKCWGCHTTGNTFVQVDGIWRVQPPESGLELGVGCAACHSHGSEHIADVLRLRSEGKPISGNTRIVRGTYDLSPRLQQESCGRCHMRPELLHQVHKGLGFPLGHLPGDSGLDQKVRSVLQSTNKAARDRYFFSDGHAKNGNSQYDEMLHGKHLRAGVTCVVCHNPHSGIPSQLRHSRTTLCSGCHGADSPGQQEAMYKDSSMQLAGVVCVDCHFAKIGQRTIRPADGKKRWQVSSHHSIAGPGLSDETAGRSSCAPCHVEKDPPFPLKKVPKKYTAQQLVSQFNQRKLQVLSTVERLQVTLNGLNLSDATAIQSMSGAQANIDIVVADGSWGVHNYPKTIRLLKEAETWLSRARSQNQLAQFQGAAQVKKVQPKQPNTSPASSPAPVLSLTQQPTPRTAQQKWTYQWENLVKDAP